MSVTFTKLFSSITASTIWAEPDHTRLVWITMLAMADQHGRVWASIPGLANMARVTLEKCEDALRALQSPDKYSRTKEHEGRRIEEIDGGWRLLNHAKYRAIRDEESIKESKRRYINARREAERASSSTVEGVEQSRTPSKPVGRGRANTEAEAYANTDKGAHTEAAAVDNSVRSLEGFKPTKAGAMCKAMRAAGLSATNPGDPRLLALIEQGATEEEFAGIAAEAAAGGKGWAWVLKVLQARRADAAALVLAPKEPEKHWTETSTGIIAKGKELGLGEPNPLEQFPVYRARVMKAAGATQA